MTSPSIQEWPHSPPLERDVVSRLLQDPHFFRLATSEGLERAHFHLPQTKIVFDVVCEIMHTCPPDRGEPVDLQILVQMLLDTGLLDRAGGPSEVCAIFTHTIGEPSASRFKQHIGVLRDKWIARETIRLTNEAQDVAFSSGTADEVAAVLKKLSDLRDSVGRRTGIAAALAEREFDHSTQPDKPIPVFSLGGKPLSTPGNISNIQAPPKAGKSAIIDALIASVMAGNRQGCDTLGFEADNRHGLALIHLDTEQSRFDADSLVRRAMRRACIEEPPKWFRSYSVADLGIGERRDALRHVMIDATQNMGGVFAVLIDGIGDLCADPNDSEESFALVQELHQLAILHDCTICTVLHENPGSEAGKTRGHLGSQLERKSETNLRLAKEKDGITTIWAEKARHCYLPKDQGPCFSWSDQVKMHISCGTSGELRQAAMRDKQTSEATSTFMGKGGLTYGELCQSIRDALDVSERTAKSRIRAWLNDGIVTKSTTGKHYLNDI